MSDKVVGRGRKKRTPLFEQYPGDRTCCPCLLPASAGSAMREPPDLESSDLVRAKFEHAGGCPLIIGVDMPKSEL